MYANITNNCAKEKGNSKASGNKKYNRQKLIRTIGKTNPKTAVLEVI